MSDDIKHPALDDTGRFEKIAEVESGGYSWGIATVWRDKAAGKLYGDSDAGCSCYGPWQEGNFTLSRCKQITHVREAGELVGEAHGEDGPISDSERRDFVRKVEVALASI